MLEFRDTCFAEVALEVRVEISVSAAASLNFRDEELRKCAERGPPFSSSSRVRFLRDIPPLKTYFLHPPAALASGAKAAIVELAVLLLQRFFFFLHRAGSEQFHETSLQQANCGTANFNIEVGGVLVVAVAVTLCSRFCGGRPLYNHDNAIRYAQAHIFSKNAFSFYQPSSCTSC